MGQIRRGLDGRKQVGYERQLGGRLAAGDGDTGEQRAVAAQQGQHLGHRHLVGLGAGTAGTGIQAAVAVGAERRLPAHSALARAALSKGERTARADSKAVATVITQPYGVRVVATRAAKVAPLQEEHQPIARPVHA
ncbi:hypothetical protein D3C71_1841230 [compost metagenome]